MSELLERGFLGTRADLLTDSFLFVLSLMPFAMLYAMRLASRGDRRRHRNVQLGLLITMLVSVVVLEVGIRSGAAEAVSQSEFAESSLLTGTFTFHLIVAVPTLVAWTWLARSSWSQFGGTLPGDYSPVHMR